MRILLIEDEKPFAELVRRALEDVHHVVDVVYDGAEGLEKAESERYSLIILDVMLPGLDGFRICRELRAARDTTPILMLTARGEVRDRVRGLDAGADDYLPKPCDLTELRARVDALVRRDKVHRGKVIRIADLEVDTVARRVTRAGKEISLTRREYALLEALAVNEGRVLTRDAIRDRIWLDENSFSNVVDVRIAILRRKIDAGHETALIHTIYGLGYVLKAEAPEGSKQ